MTNVLGAEQTNVTMLCALCKSKEADKTNTHFLTDSIIRSCLNYKGNPIRGKGYYFNVSGNSDIEFNFQQNTDIEALENALGRPATEEEIQRAMTNPFTVDRVFCKTCEDIFTDIENAFVRDILPSLRNANLDGKEKLTTLHKKTARQFFYLQFWRSAICEKQFEIPAHMMEAMRVSILNHRTIEENDVPNFPLYINYLQTIGDDEAYTSNYVGLMALKNPYTILMNDFFIQLFRDQWDLGFTNVYNLFTLDDYGKYLNMNETEFVIKITSDDRRQRFCKAFNNGEIASPRIENYSRGIVKLWIELFHAIPSNYIIHKFLNTLARHGDQVLNYSRAEITAMTIKFVKENVPYPVQIDDA